MDRKQASTALQNAVAFLKGQKIIKKEIEISTETGFSKGSVSSYITGNQIPSKNFLAKFEEVYKLNLNDFSKEMPIEIGNPAAAELEAIIRTESLVRVNASYIAEIYGHLMKVAPTKVLKEMEQMADSESLKKLAELKAR